MFTDTAVQQYNSTTVQQYSSTAVSIAMLVLLQVLQSITGIEFLNHNSEEENGYNSLLTVSSSGWQIISISPFCLSVCLSISDTLNNEQSITIHSTEAAVLNSLLTPNHSPIDIYHKFQKPTHCVTMSEPLLSFI
jgi:hypothetical protein